ncbi:MAG: hypothetical protein AAF391_11380 [Bacteroidota bacterium]
MKLNNQFLSIAGNIIFIIGAIYGILVLFDLFEIESIQNNFSGSMVLMLIGWSLGIISRNRIKNDQES